jgi:hypothetical protein
MQRYDGIVISNLMRDRRKLHSCHHPNITLMGTMIEKAKWRDKERMQKLVTLGENRTPLRTLIRLMDH